MRKTDDYSKVTISPRRLLPKTVKQTSFAFPHSTTTTTDGNFAKKAQFETPERGLELGRKSQFEIFGLAMVIILAIVAMFFLFIFMSGGERSTIVDISHTEIGANTLNTLLKTTTRCQKLTVGELITNCVEGLEFSPDKKPTVDYCPGNKNSCEYVTMITQPIINVTLSYLGLDYEFNVLGQDGEDFKPFESLKIESETACIEKKHFEHLLPRPSGLLAKVTLDIC